MGHRNPGVRPDAALLTGVYLGGLYQFAAAGVSDIRMANLGFHLPVMLRQLAKLIERTP